MTAIHCVEVGPRRDQPSPGGAAIRRTIQEFAGHDPGETRVHQLYWIAGSLTPETITELAERLLVDPVVEVFSLSTPLLAADFPQAVAYAVKPGVTDPAAGHVRMGIDDLGIAGVEAILTGTRVVFASALPADVQKRIGEKLLFNPTIQRAVAPGENPFHQPAQHPLTVEIVPIRDLDDAGLVALSRAGLFALSLEEMQRVQSHFRSIGRDPRDGELETIAQTWSEHCVHKTLKGRYILPDRTYNNLLKETIFDATVTLAKPWCVSVFEDNAGVVEFLPGLHACFKVETHNHPSAVEPYGGAGTGIGGVIRDILGTGLGAKPIANTDVFCFAPPDTDPSSIPAGTLAPKRVMHGVVSGVRDYGNRMGIPTVNGALYFDPRFLTNPLVFCGTVGLLPADRVTKAAQAGDRIGLIGGETGRDGIHGATF
ncbi:MAG: AIR synthase related protein, partial [bacterium]